MKTLVRIVFLILISPSLPVLWVIPYMFEGYSEANKFIKWIVTLFITGKIENKFF